MRLFHFIDILFVSHLFAKYYLQLNIFAYINMFIMFDKCYLMNITHILFIYDATIKCDELYSVSFRKCSSTRVFAQDQSAIDQYVIYIIFLYRHVNNYTFRYSLS